MTPDRDLPHLVEIAESAAAAAGSLIMQWYQAEDPGAREKPDTSPLTEADLAAHEAIVSTLRRETPQIPVLSEEGRQAPAAERRRWRRCWLVDPLDGTREFLARNDEFTVNIALIENGRPLLGAVGVPARGEVHTGVVPLRRAESWNPKSGARHPLHCRRFDPGHAVVVASRSHRGPEQETILAALTARFPSLEERAVGSALKLVELAAGRADGYPRRGPCSEWDIAAGEAVLLAAGGALCTWSGEALRYNKPESLLNPDFFAVADPEGALAQVLRQLGARH